MEERESLENHEPEPVEKSNSKLGCVVMVLFWLALWFFGPGWLTVVYFGLTMGALALVAKVRGTRFAEIAENNNWVFWSVLGMVIVTAFMAWANPLVPQGIGGWLRSLFSSETELTDSLFWGLINNMFFGESFTYGWSDATLTYGLWIILAFVVSFWDETKTFLGKFIRHLFKGEGLATFALKDGLMELLWGVLRRGKK